ncbi:MAG: caspase family protein [Spirochaetia bacterium]|jgi:hypothetical protein
MKKVFPWLVALGASLLASCSLTLFDYSNVTSKHYALVYGVTVYTSLYGAGFYPNLNFPDADARGVAAMLRAEGYFVVLRYVDSSGNEYLSTSSASTVLTGNVMVDKTGTSGPCKANISADIQAYFQNVVGPNDVFIFYFSGHGMQVTSSPPVEYFVPEGAVQYLNSQWVGVPSLSVADYELGSMIGTLSTKRRVVILDTCNSGGFIGNSLEADSIPPASLGSAGGVSIPTLLAALANYLNFSSNASGLSPYGDGMVLSAAGRDESCYEASSPYNHGIMTYFLLQAPQSGDLNHDGHVTVAEAFSLAKAGVDTDWNGNSAVQTAGETFEPRISGGPIDFVLW